MFQICCNERFWLSICENNSHNRPSLLLMCNLGFKLSSKDFCGSNPDHYLSDRKMKPTVQHIENCQLQAWYPTFKNVTFSTISLPLPEEFVKFLGEDGIYFSEGDQIYPDFKKEDDETEEDKNQWDTQEADSDHEEQVIVKKFPELENQINAAIEKLGGKVFPKLNWSSPKDAIWMSSNGSLECNNANQVILLLKSSDLIFYDVDHAFAQCDDSSTKPPTKYYLNLRKWQNLTPSSEFRCFVKNNLLIGISQRECSTFYPHLLDAKNSIKEAIVQFFMNNIQNKFADPNFVCDVYVTKEYDVWLVDINPFIEDTESLLFSWDELLETNTDTAAAQVVDFRIIDANNVMQPNMNLTSRVPFDMVGLSLEEFSSQLSELEAKMKQADVNSDTE